MQSTLTRQKLVKFLFENKCNQEMQFMHVHRYNYQKDFHTLIIAVYLLLFFSSYSDGPQKTSKHLLLAEYPTLHNAKIEIPFLDSELDIAMKESY